MRVEPLPRAPAPLDGLPSVLLRALSLIIIVGLIVAAIQVLPTAEENPASTAAVSSTAQVTQSTGPQNTREQAQGAKPRVIYAGPIVSSAAMPQRTPTSQDTRSAPAEVADPVAVEGQPRTAEAPVARTALLPEPEVESHPFRHRRLQDLQRHLQQQTQPISRLSTRRPSRPRIRQMGWSISTRPRSRS